MLYRCKEPRDSPLVEQGCGNEIERHQQQNETDPRGRCIGRFLARRFAPGTRQYVVYGIVQGCFRYRHHSSYDPFQAGPKAADFVEFRDYRTAPLSLFPRKRIRGAHQQQLSSDAYRCEEESRHVVTPRCRRDAWNVRARARLSLLREPPLGRPASVDTYAAEAGRVSSVLPTAPPATRHH